MRHLILCLIMLSLCLGCKAAETEKPADAPKADATAPADAPKADALALVEVPKEGKEFNPPVKPEQIPAGAYYCDMGTVEYARMDKGDGKCPVCGMMLKQKPGGAEAPAAPAAPADAPKAAEGHEGHDHH